MAAGRIISHYEILEKLGEGGMGVVSLARDTRLGRQVALKVLRPDICCADDQKQRFLQEARTASSLNHPNIITIYDIDSVDGVDVIAMEYVRGRSLQEWIGRQGVSLADAMEFAVQIARALEAAHEAGIVHRDIKPANIMVSESGLVKVLDFGLAKITQPSEPAQEAGVALDDTGGEAAAPHTLAGMVLGTVSYMSPEQASGRPVDARSDLFAFGAVMYEMLSGRKAFSGETNAAVADAVLRHDPVPLRQLLPDVPRELERIVARCLKKDPNRRFQDAADLRVALEEIREEMTSGAFQVPAGAARPGFEPRLVWFALVVIAGVAFAWWRFLGPEPNRPVLTRLTSDPGLTGFPAVSPDGSLIGYASDKAGQGNLDIWVQQISGGNPIQLTRSEVDEYEPVFSPDGTRIAFRSEKEGGGVYIVSTLGGESRLLVREGRSPAFSPDGTRIAYAVGAPGVGATFSFGASNLHVIAVGGGEQRRLADEFAVAHHPVWTPDGKYILFEGGLELGPPTFDLWTVPAGGGAPVATGVFQALRNRGFRIGPYPFALTGDSVILSTGLGDSVNLWRVALSRITWKSVGPPQQLTFGTGLERQPSVARDGLVVFGSGQDNTDLWELPVDTSRGAVRGDPRQLTRDAADDYYPVIASNGSRIAFVSHRTGNDDVWLLDPSTGAQHALVNTAAREMYPKLSADGSMVAFGAVDDNRRGLFTMPASGGTLTRLCDDCGILRDMTADASRLVLQLGPPPHVGVMDVATRKIEVVLRNQKLPIYAPKLSPDGKWIAFQAVERPAARILYVAPLGGPVPVPAEQWIRVTDGAAMDRNPAWSPDGSVLYFLSERDSFRCIWAVRLDPETKRPVEAAFPVAHFHNAVRSLMNIDGPGQVSLSVGPGRLVFAMGEMVGNLWMANLR